MTQRRAREGGSDFGGELRRYRETAGLSQEELAERAGLTAKGISAIERGERRNPYPQTVRALAEALSLSDADRSALIAAVPRRGRSERADQDGRQERRISTQLVDTKLFAPRRRTGVVVRPRLHARLNAGWSAKLILVSAPAGFGKTTLLSDWLATGPAEGRSVAWLSLDQGDNDPALFWAYVVRALESVTNVLGSARQLDELPTGASLASVLATLLNELAAATGDIVVVLDDFHLIESPEIQDQVAYVLEHLPPQIHIVITTRADPALSLSAMRARGTLVEIRVADLRFTPDEAAAYLTGVMGLPLTASDVATLDERTEGWIAALQLAALSMQGRTDPGSFIEGFAGDDRYVVDYLVEEVLRRQPDAVQQFLLRTSILDRLVAGLCDAVVGVRGSRSTLEALDRGNVFVVALDDQRRWYRYHHLFADVLRARLLDEDPEVVPDLHRRASHWYEQDGDTSQAITHALAAEDFDRAADLIELAIRPMSQRRQEATVRRWLDGLPEHLFDRRPVLAVGSAGIRLVRADVEGVDARLRQAERWLEQDARTPREPLDPRGMVVVDAEAFGRLPASIAMYRTALAFGEGDAEGTIASAQRLLALAGAEDHVERGGAAGFLGLATWTLGDLDAAYHWWSEAAARLEAGGHISDAIGSRIALGDIRIAQGRIVDANQIYEAGVALAGKHSSSSPRGAPDMLVGKSRVAYERNDITAARDHLLSSEQLGGAAALAQNPYRSRVALARIRVVEGHVEAALSLLDEAEGLYASDFYPNIQPIPAVRARIWIALGRADEAVGWAREHGVSADDELSYVREFDHITLARLLALTERTSRQPSSRRGAELLERLRSSAEGGGRAGSLIEILVLQALGHASRGEAGAALESLDRALTLAEPQGHVRVFLDEGPAIAALLEAAARRGVASTYASHLLAAARDDAPGATANRALVEPLSERELEVLGLLASDMDGAAIAAALVVSLHTVRSHTKKVYAKLGVGDRRAAVRRGAELNLLPGAHSR